MTDDDDYDRTLFLKFDSAKWTEEELNNLMESLETILPDDTSAMALGDSIEFMDKDEVEDLVGELVYVADGY